MHLLFFWMPFLTVYLHINGPVDGQSFSLESIILRALIYYAETSLSFLLEATILIG